MNNPFVAVYGIYKNEERYILRFLNSVKDADEIVLCDTGSDDKTNSIIKEFIKENPDINIKIYRIYITPFRFDDARNTALSLVNPHADLCISLDMDEYLCHNWKECIIKNYDEEITRYYHKFKTYFADGTISEHLHERIHKREGYTWKLPVHEILEYKTDEKVKLLEDLWIYQKYDHKETRKSYLPLLEQSVKERDDIWKSWSFLASEYLIIGEIQKALRCIDRAMELSDSDKGFLNKQKYFVYKQCGDREKALLNLENAILFMPQRREMYFEKARFLYDNGNFAEAKFVLEKAEKIKNKILDYNYNYNAWGDEFEKFKEIVYERAGEEGSL